MFTRLIDPLVSLIYPRSCGSCGGAIDSLADGAACAVCWNETAIFGDETSICSKCGVPISEALPSTNLSCGECGEHQYDISRSAGSYEKALTATVLEMKKDAGLSATARGHFLTAVDRLDLDGDTLLVPVPLSKQRNLERGFNQAEILAAAASRHTGLPLDAYSLVRRLDTPMHRAAMDKKARESTVKNAFEVVRPNMIRGRDILLIDDLMTSGSTASQCAKALKKSGAGKVTVMTLARAGKV